MHVPVLLQETIRGLNLSEGDNCIDGTVGAGGHARAILEATAPKGRLIGFDRDAESLKRATEALREFGDRFIPMHDSYANIADSMESISETLPVAGIVLDLGLSSDQMDDPTRGFSFKNRDAELDMRFDRSGSDYSAADVLDTAPVEELTRIFRSYGEMMRPRRFAMKVEERRKQQPFATVGDLLDLAEECLPRGRRQKIHPATTLFQALRIAVNDELGALERFLPVAVNMLKPGGRIAVISFHSLEDRIVKQYFRLAAQECVCPPELPECRCEHESTLSIITKKPIVPSEEETKTNPRSRSAKLRIAEKK
ncbi:MAG: 16S rRNA (cytosine(1402)-N(4))-methyltransferase RsmH [Candidatus Kerfeldbacteria bacterium]